MLIRSVRDPPSATVAEPRGNAIGGPRRVCRRPFQRMPHRILPRRPMDTCGLNCPNRRRMGPDPSSRGAREAEEPRRRRAIVPTLATRFHRRGGSLSRAGTGLLDHRGGGTAMRAPARPPTQGPKPWPQATGPVPDERFHRPLDDAISRPRWAPRIELAILSDVRQGSPAGSSCEVGSILGLSTRFRPAQRRLAPSARRSRGLVPLCL